MKSLQASRKSTYIVAAFLGAFILSVPIAVMANPSLYYTTSSQGKTINVSNTDPNTLFFGNSSSIPCGNGTSVYNFAGIGGNDTFVLYPGNDTTLATLTGFANNYFTIDGTGSCPGSIFSMVTGANSTFNIVQSTSGSGTTFIITGGANSLVNESTGGSVTGPVGQTLYAINLGANSSVILNSDFQGNTTTANIIF